MKGWSEDECWDRVRAVLGSEYTRPILLPWLLWAAILSGSIGLVVWIAS